MSDSVGDNLPLSSRGVVDEVIITCLDKYSLLVSLPDAVWVVPVKSQLAASYRHCSIANYGRWRVTLNLAAPFYRVRSVNSHRLGDILRNCISLRLMAR